MRRDLLPPPRTALAIAVGLLAVSGTLVIARAALSIVRWLAN